MAKFSIPPKPAGVHPRSHFRRIVYEYLFGGQFPIKGMDGIEVEYVNSTYFVKGGRKGAGAGAEITVLKYNSAKASVKGKFYKVRPDDEAVTTGVTIGVAPNAIIKYATPGKYLCLKSVAAHTSATLTGEIPQLPDPVSTDPEFAGTPSKHWEWFSPAHACVDGETHVA